jgi:Rod binding domain-containing protein
VSADKLPGIDALQSPDMNAWSAKLEAAQAARGQAQVEQAAAELNSAGKAAGKDPKELAQLRKVSQDFESIFLAYMMKTMKAAMPKSEFLGQSEGEKIFTEMKDEELAKGMAKAGGIGLGRLLEQQLVQSLKPAGPAAAAQKPLF